MADFSNYNKQVPIEEKEAAKVKAQVVKGVKNKQHKNRD